MAVGTLHPPADVAAVGAVFAGHGTAAGLGVAVFRYA